MKFRLLRSFAASNPNDAALKGEVFGRERVLGDIVK